MQLIEVRWKREKNVGLDAKYKIYQNTVWICFENGARYRRPLRDDYFPNQTLIVYQWIYFNLGSCV